MKFSCPYPAEVSEQDGGCPEGGSWEVDAHPDLDPATGEEIRIVSQEQTRCPSCHRTGVADSKLAVVVHAPDAHAHRVKWIAKLAKLVKGG